MQIAVKTTQAVAGMMGQKVGGFHGGFHGNTTLWLFNIAMENGPFIDGLPIKHGDFPVRYVK